jgi:uncharacterized membrane protein YccC
MTIISFYLLPHFIAISLIGGLAAPFIAAGLAAVGTTGTATFAALATTATVSTIFGTTGAGLASYKMNRRTMGLTVLF